MTIMRKTIALLAFLLLASCDEDNIVELTPSVSGVVVDSLSPTTLMSNVTVTVQNKTMTTGQTGTFFFSDLTAGMTTITARRSGYRDLSQQIEVRRNEVNNLTLRMVRE